MSEMHKPMDNWKERLAAHAVPGGWVCVVDCSERVGEDIYRPVFVPDPAQQRATAHSVHGDVTLTTTAPTAPHALVAMQTVEGDEMLVDFDRGFMLSAAPGNRTFVALRGGGVASTQMVEGTPREVAERLGLAVRDE